MMFPDHTKGLSEFYRVIKSGGRAAISVTANAERSFYAPSKRVLPTRQGRLHIGGNLFGDGAAGAGRYDGS
jgi:hypothetical protein